MQLVILSWIVMSDHIKAKNSIFKQVVKKPISLIGGGGVVQTPWRVPPGSATDGPVHTGYISEWSLENNNKRYASKGRNFCLLLPSRATIRVKKGPRSLHRSLLPNNKLNISFCRFLPSPNTVTLRTWHWAITSRKTLFARSLKLHFISKYSLNFFEWSDKNAVLIGEVDFVLERSELL